MQLMKLVLDTNIALDLLVFDDPACEALAAALRSGTVCWLATPAMRRELQRVLGYPAIAARLARRRRDVPTVLAAFDALAQPTGAAAPAPCRCADPDDQIFIDLAVAHRALLLSKDAAVLSMRKSLAAHAVQARPAMDLIAEHIPPAAGRPGA